MPETKAGRRLEQRLAYDKDPAHYEPGDYFIEYRPLIDAIEAEAAAAERERVLDPSRLSRAIHAYGGLCRSRYGRVTCGPDDHIVMATALRAAVLALLVDPAEPEPGWLTCPECGQHLHPAEPITPTSPGTITGEGGRM